MEEIEAEILSTEISAPGTFVPPSIDYDILLSGESYEHYSPVPQSLLAPPVDVSCPDVKPIGPPCSLGVDEAGRGPVLGPMVYGAFYLPIDLERPLLADFDDSKVLTPGFRAQLMEQLCREPAPEGSVTKSTADEKSLFQNCGWAVSLLSARTISAGMLQPTSSYNLNAQAMDATISLISKVYAMGVNVREIYIDTIGPPAPYQKKLERIFPLAKIVVAKKADSLYPCVSAASVCAKVTRDVALEVIYSQNYGSNTAVAADNTGTKGEEKVNDGVEWGSGYPSDQRCTNWMKRNVDPLFGWGSEARFSWGTAKDMLETKGVGVGVAWPVERDDESMGITDFFGAEGDRKGDELAGWFGSRASAEIF